MALHKVRVSASQAVSRLRGGRFSFVVVLVLAVVGIGLGVRPTLARQSPQELVRQADRNWNEQSYLLATEAYQQALKADPKLPNRAEIEYRIMVGLGRAKRWDAAVTAAEKYVETYHDTVWEARGQVWRGRLYRIVEHHGYLIGERLYRGSDVPKSEGGNGPVETDRTGEDLQESEDALVRAQELFTRFRAARLAPQERDALTAAEIDLDFDLAETTAQIDDTANFDPDKTDWTIDLTLPYDTHWPAARRVMTLYARIAQLDPFQ